MRVMCTCIINELDKHQAPHAIQCRRLTVGRVYDVIEVSCDFRAGMCWYRIECDDGKPELNLSTQFRIVTNEIPRTWIVNQWDSGITFCPEPWLQEGFWRRLADGDPAARRVFHEEIRKFSI